MGYAISWIALKDKSGPEAAQMLALSQTGEFEEVPSSMFSAVSFESGWYVVVIQEYAHKFVSDNSLRRLSVSGAVVAAAIEEHVMFSSAQEWNSENLIWKVSHAAEKGPRDLEERGLLPEGHASIKERLLAAQQQEDDGAREVDYVFEVPLELAESVVGFKHDKLLAARFEILEPAPASASGGLFSRLFSKQ